MTLSRSELKASPDTDTSQLVNKLRALHAHGDQSAAPIRTLGQLMSPPTATPQGYADLQGQIAGLENQLRHHADAVDARLDPPAAAAPAAMTQATLFLQGAADSPTGGQFICRNRLDHAAEIKATIGTFKDSSGQHVDGIMLTLQGHDAPLAPQEARMLKVRIDLSAATPRPEGQLEGWVELQQTGAAALRLWIEVDLHD